MGSSDALSEGLRSEEDMRSAIRASREVSDPFGPPVDRIEGFLNSADQEFFDSLKANRPYLSIVTERFMQTIDDFQLSSRIKEKEKKLDLQKANLQYAYEEKQVEKKERVVVLGTGWGGHALLKSIDGTVYDVTVISPRNYFTFTPMLAASVVGTVELRSIIEPIRNVNRYVNYLEASAISVNSGTKTVSCESVKCAGTSCGIADFAVEYDHLIIAVGAATNTFGIKGVRENCQFLKQVEDALNLRKTLAYCFERANLPNLKAEEIRDALSFVIVGAGPTGVEFTSELRDWMETEGRRYYRHLLPHVKISLVEAGSAVLPVFDANLQKEALQKLTARETNLIRDGYIKKEMVEVRLKSGVKEVHEKYLEFSNGERLNYGFCVWAAGNGPIPFVLNLIESNSVQKAKQAVARGRIVTDKWLRVEGMDNVYCIGDCGFIAEGALPATAQVASQQGSYLGRLFSKGFNMSAIRPLPPDRFYAIPLTSSENNSSISDIEDQRFASDRIRLGRLSVDSKFSDDSSNVAVEYAKTFQFLNLGVLAYVGASEALAQISVDQNTIKGKGSLGFLLWRGIYWFKQVSWRNRLLISVDWIKASVFGRDISTL